MISPPHTHSHMHIHTPWLFWQLLFSCFPRLGALGVSLCGCWGWLAVQGLLHCLVMVLSFQSSKGERSFCKAVPAWLLSSRRDRTIAVSHRKHSRPFSVEAMCTVQDSHLTVSPRAGTPPHLRSYANGLQFFLLHGEPGSALPLNPSVEHAGTKGRWRQDCREWVIHNNCWIVLEEICPQRQQARILQGS